MAYTATLISTSFRLQEPVEQSVLSIEALLEDPYVMDGYPVELYADGGDTFSLGMLDSAEVGDSFQERIEALLTKMRPFLQGAVQVTLRNCDTASDDRDTVLYEGASPQDIQDLKRSLAIQEAIEVLAGAGLTKDDPALAPLLAARAEVSAAAEAAPPRPRHTERTM